MKVYQRSAELLEAGVGDELVALEPELGLCFALNSVANDVWQQLKSPRSFEQLKAHLLAEYDVDEAECSRDLQELLDQLTQRRLVSSSGG